MSGAPEVPDASRENTVTFVKKDGCRVQLHIDLSPSKGGNQLTLTSPEAHQPAAPAKPDPSAPPIALASAVAAAGSVTELVRLTADIMSETLSAEFAASAIAEAIEAGDVTATGLAPYEERWRGALASEIRQGMRLRRLLEQLPESAVEHLHRLLGVPGLRHVLAAAAPSLDWHSSKLTRVLERLDRHREAGPASAR